MRRPLAIVCLLACLPALAGAQGGPRQEAWQRVLGAAPDLIVKVEALRSGLEAGDPSVPRAQFASPRVGLLLRGDGLRLTLLAPGHAGLLLDDYLKRHRLPHLRVTMARLAESGLAAEVALDLHGGASGGVARAARVVASYRREGTQWRLSRLLCP